MRSHLWAGGRDKIVRGVGDFWEMVPRGNKVIILTSSNMPQKFMQRLLRKSEN